MQSLTTFQPAPIIVASTNDKSNRKRSTGTKSSANWWAPIFGWSGDANYMEKENVVDEEGQKRPRKFCVLTEEKARELRKKTTELESFHDGMYHSAVASRLALDGKVGRSGSEI